MPKPKKKRNKKYNPNKISERLLNLRARKCALYRWGFSPKNTLIAQGPPPLTERQVQDVMRWAKGRPNRWLVTCYACFLAEDGDYYEESAQFVTDQVILDSDEGVWDLEKGALEIAKAEGNENHFLDTVTTCQLLTEDTLEKSEDDAWIKRQAAYRAQIIRQELAR